MSCSRAILRIQRSLLIAMRFLVPEFFSAKSHHTVGAAIVSFLQRQSLVMTAI